MLGLIARRLLLVLFGTIVGAVAGRARRRFTAAGTRPGDVAGNEAPSDVRAVPAPAGATTADETVHIDPGAPPVDSQPHVLYTELTPEATAADAGVVEPVKWLQPVDGKCPDTHRVKARFSTGRYHRPGDRGYDRIAPDCCYESAEDAQSDGFSRARW